MSKNKRLDAIIKSKEDQWLDSITKDHCVEEGCFGIEIVGRILIREEQDHQYIEEILEKIREIGAAEITRRVKL